MCGHLPNKNDLDREGPSGISGFLEIAACFYLRTDPTSVPRTFPSANRFSALIENSNRELAAAPLETPELRSLGPAAAICHA
jgi:hypothetical protein